MLSFPTVRGMVIPLRERKGIATAAGITEALLLRMPTKVFAFILLTHQRLEHSRFTSLLLVIVEHYHQFNRVRLAANIDLKAFDSGIPPGESGITLGDRENQRNSNKAYWIN